MHYIVESSKSFYEATFDLVPTIQRLGFVVLATHDLGGLLQRKDIDLDDDCQIVEICNYRYVEKLLAIDMRFSAPLADFSLYRKRCHQNRRQSAGFMAGNLGRQPRTGARHRRNRVQTGHDSGRCPLTNTACRAE
jgi:hypothetical protein